MDNDNRLMTAEEVKRIGSAGNSAGYDVVLEVDGDRLVLGSFSTPGVAYEFMASERKDFEQQGLTFDESNKLYVSERK